MPPKTAKRKTKSTTGQEDDPWGPPQEQPEKKRRALASRTKNDDKDPGPETNKHADTPQRQFQSWAEWQSKFKDKERNDRIQFADKFKKDIETKREIAETLLGKSSEDLNEAACRYGKLLNKACAGIERSARSGTTKEHALNSPKDESLAKSSREILQTCRDLVAAHEQANVRTVAQGNMQLKEMRAIWSEDVSQAEKVLLYGAQYGERIIEHNVDLLANVEERSHLLTPPWDALKGPGQIALDMHLKSAEKLMKGSPTWGEQAVICVDKLMDIIALLYQAFGSLVSIIQTPGLGMAKAYGISQSRFVSGQGLLAVLLEDQAQAFEVTD
ncbi:hypothetical protein M406DRAFT_68640 [Cryphonectria parasitica EP155]|uniref:Uncharacterized protein n=1 Tax=Cryphonectria parasitica (strain ATCC 38755 / EP155) TaxID=660469 RepID=A0A9P5CQJ7_CRYP1|nr:uncharacterized protein M406DRAFT_68640 [Cryphonectria parasitica EP155]KAF3766281.1 hypothetical protein M406DRAFT_68640 [Cryphonectria parasitica EP155]